jgi:hypothetical protein
MTRYVMAVGIALLLFTGCDSSGGFTVYNPTNTGYNNFVEEPVHVYAERSNDGITKRIRFTCRRKVMTPRRELSARHGKRSRQEWTGWAGAETVRARRGVFRGCMDAQIRSRRVADCPQRVSGEEAILDGTTIPRLDSNQFWGMISATGLDYIQIRDSRFGTRTWRASRSITPITW